MKNYSKIIRYNVLRTVGNKVYNNVWNNVTTIYVRYIVFDHVVDNIKNIVWENVRGNCYRKVLKNIHKSFQHNHLQQYKDNI